MNGWGCYACENLDADLRGYVCMVTDRYIVSMKDCPCFGDGGRFLCDPEDEDVILEGVFP